MSDDLFDSLQARGLLADASSPNSLRAHLGAGSRTLYCGFDPTADSLHVGNLVPLLALRRFQEAGHRPILLIGGATGLIGDPSGRSAERTLQAVEVVDAHAKKISAQAARFLDFDGPGGALLVNNADWTRGLDFIGFLRDVGKHFSVNVMLQKESVKRRLGREESGPVAGGEVREAPGRALQGVYGRQAQEASRLFQLQEAPRFQVQDDPVGFSYTEFSYLVLQAHDFVVLNERYGCSIQLGGSDQWGNITSGIDLVRRMRGEQAYGITFPLVCNADGSKFGKSSGGAIWLDPERTSPYAFYQFWLNSADADVMPFLRLFTFLADEELAELEAAHLADPGRRTAHRALAREVTELVHGAAGRKAAERITEAMFANRLAELAEPDLDQLVLDGLPVKRVVAERERLSLADALVELNLAVTPKGEVTEGQARKLIQGNSVAVNGSKVTNVQLELNRKSALFGRFHLLQKGRKHHALLEWAATG